MFKINADGSIYVTRGDTCTISVSAKVNGEPHKFKAGDVLRIKVYERKACHCVVLQKDFAILAETEVADLVLTERDTRIGELINKPVDYWYEIELNPLTSPQTIIGYDDDGAKAFRLFPEAADNEVVDPPEPEDIPVVDHELDLLSTRPVENQAVTRAILEVKEASEQGIQRNAETIQQNAEGIQRNAEAIQQNRDLLEEHKEDKDNPHCVTKAQVGLDQVDNTSDADKPVSIAQKEAIDGLRKQMDEHNQSQSNPHQVTAAQLGLDQVDNTSDMDKPVSTAQEEAIAEAKQAGTDAQTAADNAQATADSAQAAADSAQVAADNAQNTANLAHEAAADARAEAASKTSVFTAQPVLRFIEWEENKQTVSVPGVTENKEQPIFITPDPDSMEAYSFFKVKPETQGVDEVTFSCEAVPNCDITMNIVGFTVPAEEV